MKEQLVTFDTAVLAKEKGFNETCRAAYRETEDNLQLFDNGCSQQILSEFYILAPTQSLLQKWLREKHNILVYCKPVPDDSNRWSVYVDDSIGHHHVTKYIYENTYEDVLEKGLQESLKLI